MIIFLSNGILMEICYLFYFGERVLLKNTFPHILHFSILRALINTFPHIFAFSIHIIYPHILHFSILITFPQIYWTTLPKNHLYFKNPSCPTKRLFKEISLKSNCPDILFYYILRGVPDNKYISPYFALFSHYCFKKIFPHILQFAIHIRFSKLLLFYMFFSKNVNDHISVNFGRLALKLGPFDWNLCLLFRNAINSHIRSAVQML